MGCSVAVVWCSVVCNVCRVRKGAQGRRKQKQWSVARQRSAKTKPTERDEPTASGQGGRRVWCNNGATMGDGGRQRTGGGHTLAVLAFLAFAGGLDWTGRASPWVACRFSSRPPLATRHAPVGDYNLPCRVQTRFIHSSIVHSNF